jgi:hypothetical protein
VRSRNLIFQETSWNFHLDHFGKAASRITREILRNCFWPIEISVSYQSYILQGLSILLISDQKCRKKFFCNRFRLNANFVKKKKVNVKWNCTKTFIVIRLIFFFHVLFRSRVRNFFLVCLIINPEIVNFSTRDGTPFIGDQPISVTSYKQKRSENTYICIYMYPYPD